MAKDWRFRLDPGRDERSDPLIRKSIIGREPGKTQFFWDDKVPGFGLKITDKGHESFVYQFRTPERRHAVRVTFKDVHSVAQARAMAAAKSAERYTEAAERPSSNPETLREVVAAYLATKGADYKSRREFERSLDNHVLPTLGDRPYESIGRRDLAELKRSIIAKVSAATGKPGAGKHAARTVLKNLAVVWNQYYRDFASDNYTWPEVTSPLKGETSNGNGRKLSDAEIREILAATFQLPSNKGAYWRFLFYTGMRRTFAARISKSQVVGDVLHIPGSRTKPPYELPLSAPAAELLNAHFDRMWAFQPLGPFATLKRDLDKKLTSVAPWKIHHIRHSVRSLLSRAKVRPDIGELCLGHSLRGMQKTYDHYEYQEETRAAFEALATLLATITR
jgi:hypothetical protein